MTDTMTPPPPPSAPTPPPAPPQAPATDAAPKAKSLKGVWIGIAIAALLLCCCIGAVAALGVFGLGGAIAIPALGGAEDSAQKTACFSNERTLEGAYMQSLASTPDAQPPTDFTSLQSGLVLDGYLKAPLTCPRGGVYEWDSNLLTVTCNIHGHY